MDEVIRIIDTYSISFGTRYVGTSYSFIFLFLLAFMHHFPKNSKNSGFIGFTLSHVVAFRKFFVTT